MWLFNDKQVSADQFGQGLNMLGIESVNLNLMSASRSKIYNGIVSKTKKDLLEAVAHPWFTDKQAATWMLAKDVIDIMASNNRETFEIGNYMPVADERQMRLI